MAADENERSFTRFSNDLLAAEETVHRSGKVALYSPEALQMILSEFCRIIADDLEAQSCTIQLKLHDSGTCAFLNDRMSKQSSATSNRTRTADEKRQIRRYRRRVKADFKKKWKQATIQDVRRARAQRTRAPSTPDGRGKDRTSRRDMILRSSDAFPYCIYPKGAMCLVAANEASPWSPFVGWLLTDLRKGITAEIVQEKSARVRDPFSMRRTRSYRKLGDIDPYLWTNARPAGYPEQCPRFFFNYYAAPIRIHSGGDVIGVIKIENKGFAYIFPPRGEPHDSHIDATHRLHDVLNEVLKCQHCPGDDGRQLRKLHDRMNKASGELDEYVKPRDRSVLSLIYLAYEMSKCAPQAAIEPLLTTSYFSTGEPPWRLDERPPVQLVFDRIEEERRFLKWAGFGDDQTLETILKIRKKFYLPLNENLSRQRNQVLARQIEDALKERLAGRGVIGVSLATDPKLVDQQDRIPDFFYRVEVKKARHGSEVLFKFHLQVCPSEAEAENQELLATYWELGPRSNQYNKTVQKPGVLLSGEFIRGKDQITSLRADRLAARIQAFTHSFPVPDFPPPDTWKLSWAALEIGRLIERQISYSGTHAEPIVPLTSDDFFRIPISDLSFVEGIRQQHQYAHSAENAIRYHMPNICRDLGFTWGIANTERIKTFRSYFDRLGQAHRASVDAVTAIWSYMLFRKLELERLEPVGVMPLLSDLARDMRKIWPPRSKARREFDQWRRGLGRWLKPGAGAKDEIFPDIRFSAPALDLTDELRAKAINCLRNNLIASPNCIEHKEGGSEFTAEELLELLYRRYDVFIGMVVSLYLQLRNGNDYIKFYRQTRRILEDLRNRLEALEEQVTRAPQEGPIATFSEKIAKLRAGVLSLSTPELAANLGIPAAATKELQATELLRFSVQGIYKRIRTLANVSANQMTPAVLNWESGRLDYLGSRSTCLFKNQVFALYEHLWKLGDPFRQKNENEEEETPAGAQSSPSRQRWLCIRTKVHAGKEGYNAWQIAALMDPFAVTDKYWENNAYTLNALRQILPAAHRRWSGHDSLVIATHERLTKARLSLQKQYCAWFSHATNVLDLHPSKPPKKSTLLFGHYLGETPLDVLVHILKNDENKHLLQWKTLTSHVDRLGIFIKAAGDYSKKVVGPVIVRGEKDLPAGQKEYSYRPRNALLKAGKDLYDWVTDLVDDAEKENRLGLDSAVRNDLADEWALFESGADSAQAPIVFVNQEVADKLRALLPADAYVAGKKRRIGRSVLDDLARQIRQIQGSQMDYLFELPKEHDAPPLRGQDDVIDKILCYLLLHHPDAYDAAALSPQQSGAISAAPDAYDLFYYVMSLIPVEFQIRTALANTMAEQYHKIYKMGAETLNVATIQQDRLQGIGRELDATDREFEVQFEDYIAHKKGRWSR